MALKHLLRHRLVKQAIREDTEPWRGILFMSSGASGARVFSCQLELFVESLFMSSGASGADSFWKLAENVVRLCSVAKSIAANASVPKLTVALKPHGLTFKGKAITEANVKDLKCYW